MERSPAHSLFSLLWLCVKIAALMLLTGGLIALATNVVIPEGSEGGWLWRLLGVIALPLGLGAITATAWFMFRGQRAGRHEAASPAPR